MRGGFDWRWGLGWLVAITCGCAQALPVVGPPTPYHVLNAPWMPGMGGDNTGYGNMPGPQPGQVDIYDSHTNLVTYNLDGPPVASSSQPGYGPERAVDDDWNTEWASGGYRQPWAALDLNFRNPNRFGRVVIKTGKTDRDYYVIQVWDGQNWVDASQRIQSRDWQPHSYYLQLPPRARRLRVMWFNDYGTTDHASVFGVAVYPQGPTGGGYGPGESTGEPF